MAKVEWAAPAWLCLRMTFQMKGKTEEYIGSFTTWATELFDKVADINCLDWSTVDGAGPRAGEYAYLGYRKRLMVG